MNETLPTQPGSEQGPQIVSYEQVTYANGIDHLYGVDDRGNRHHLAYDDVLEQYLGSDQQSAAEQGSPDVLGQPQNPDQLPAELGIEDNPVKTPAPEEPPKTYADMLRRGGRLAEDRRRKAEAAEEYAELADKAATGLQNMEVLKRKRENRESELKWQNDMDAMRADRDAREKDRETKAWQARMGIIDESEVPEERKSSYPVPINEAAENRQSEYAQLLKIAEGRTPDTGDETKNLDSSATPPQEILEKDLDQSQAELLEQLRAEDEASKDAELKRIMHGLLKPGDGIEDVNPEGAYDIYVQQQAKKDAARLKRIGEQGISTRQDYDEALAKEAAEAAAKAAAGASDDGTDKVAAASQAVAGEPSSGTADKATGETGKPADSAADKHGDNDAAGAAATNGDSTGSGVGGSRGFFNRRDDGTGKPNKDYWMSISDKIAAIPQVPFNLALKFNGLVNEKLPEKWSDRRKNVAKGAGVVVLSVAGILMFKYASDLFNGDMPDIPGAGDSTPLPDASPSPDATPESTLAPEPSAEPSTGPSSGESDSGGIDTTSGLEDLADEDLTAGSVDDSGEVHSVGPEEETPAEQPEQAEQATNLAELNVAEDAGFIETFQDQYGLDHEEAERAYEAVKQHLRGAEGTYMENGEVRIISPGSFDIPQKAQTALEEYLKDIGKL